MTRMPARAPALLAVAVALVLLALPGVALSQIGQPAHRFVDAVGAAEGTLDDDAFETAGGVRVELIRRGETLHSLRGEALLDESGLLDVAAIVAAGTGMGEDIAGPVVEFLTTRASDYAGRGPSVVGVGRHLLTLDVRGTAAPYQLAFGLELAEIDAARFPPARHTFGPADAALVVREFSDFQCPSCKRFAERVLPGLEAALRARGDVRYEFHHFPLRSIHANAVRAAEASECAADAAPDDDTAFWRYHDALYEHQAAWAVLADPVDYFVGLAEGLELDGERVATCLREGARRDTVERAYAAAVGLQLRGTPTLFVNGFLIEDFADPAAYAETIAVIEAFSVDEAAPD
jgi:protein-disulfide isomerase